MTLHEAEVYGNLLVNKEIMTIKGKELMMKRLTEGSVEVNYASTVKPIIYSSSELSSELILEFCTDAFLSAQRCRLLTQTGVEQKIVPEDSYIERNISYNMFTGGRLTEDYIHPKRSSIGLTRTRTLKDFKEIGLISETVYKEGLKGLKDSTLKDEAGLLQFLTSKSLYYRYYNFHREEQKSYIQALVKMGILETEVSKQLLNSYKDKELKSIPDILLFSQSYIAVDLSNYDPNPQTKYPIIFEHVKKLIPDFKYTDLKIALIESKEDNELIREDILLSFTANGQSYSNLFFHGFKRIIPTVTENTTPSLVDDDYHKAINKWLTDQESLYRLYTVYIPESVTNYHSQNKTGLLLLKKGEAEKIISNINLISRESFDNRLSQKNITRLISEFNELGFFSNLSRTEVDSSIVKIATTDIASIPQILLNFPNLLVVFDWETANLENPYEELTQRFMKASRGTFTVSNIIDEFKKSWGTTKKVKYGFTMNGKKYSTLLSFEGDWLDPAFLDLLKKAWKENNIDGNIHYFIDNGQESGYVFLNARQLRFIKEKYPDLLQSE